MRTNLIFRAWVYFRMGWSVYFAFIFAAINTLIVTYYLAIEKYPSLKEIFPSFAQYVAIIVSIGMPLLVVIGYVHFKKSQAFKAEADINIEANPYQRRILLNTEILLKSYLHLTELLIKLSKKEEITKEDLDELSKIQTKLSEHIDKRVIQ